MQGKSLCYSTRFSPPPPVLLFCKDSMCICPAVLRHDETILVLTKLSFTDLNDFFMEKKHISENIQCIFSHNYNITYFKIERTLIHEKSTI